MNEGIHILGRNGFQLDDHSFQLIIAKFETDGSLGIDKAHVLRGVG